MKGFIAVNTRGFFLRRLNNSRLDKANQVCISSLAIPILFEVLWALLFVCFVFFSFSFLLFCFVLQGTVQGGGGFLPQGLATDSFLFLIDFWLSLVEQKEVVEFD